jgi:hypothetical protein
MVVRTVLPPVQLHPDLVGAVDLHVGIPDALDLRFELSIAPGSSADQQCVPLASRVAPVSRRGELQNLADRLDPASAAVLIDEGFGHFSRRSSSAWAKNALAGFRISLARRSS